LSDENLLVGFEGNEDASVYKISETHAIVNTLDFITPIVDDPYDFGQIAAANSLSDVYVMGGKPLVAQNIICFPATSCNIEELKQILQGGADKVAEATAVISGGHSISDQEPKYGLSVTGIVEIPNIIKTQGAKHGDILLMTKKIGGGILTTAHKGDLLKLEDLKELIANMKQLNKIPEAVIPYIHSATDITGFGLMIHSYDMIAHAGLSIEIDYHAVPIYDRTLEFAEKGKAPGGTRRNQLGLVERYELDGVSEAENDILFDPQTSGGILMTIAENDLDFVRDAFKTIGTEIAQIGTVQKSENEKIIVRK
jgi:selenide,water dikinase